MYASTLWLENVYQTHWAWLNFSLKTNFRYTWLKKTKIAFSSNFYKANIQKVDIANYGTSLL